MPGNAFAERKIDALGVVDEEAQRFGPRLLDGDQVELGVELGKLLLDVVFEVWHAGFCLVRDEKKVGQAHFSLLHRDKKLRASIARWRCGRAGVSPALLGFS